MNSSYTNSGGWTDSAMRTSLNSASDDSSICTTKLNGMTIAGETVNPVAIPSTASLKSLDYNGGTPQVIETTGDKFWLPSLVEVYGTSAWANKYPAYYSGDEECTQFAYYASLQLDPTDYSTNPLASSSWRWLRSVSPDYDSNFMVVYGSGGATDAVANAAGGVVPCFCL